MAPYSPLSYPDHHPGWSALIDDLALPPEPDRGHVPLRWRMLVHYRDNGATFAECGRLLGGLSPQVAIYHYMRWRPKVCCKA